MGETGVRISLDIYYLQRKIKKWLLLWVPPPFKHVACWKVFVNAHWQNKNNKIVKMMWNISLLFVSAIARYWSWPSGAFCGPGPCNTPQIQLLLLLLLLLFILLLLQYLLHMPYFCNNSTAIFFKIDHAFWNGIISFEQIKNTSLFLILEAASAHWLTHSWVLDP